MLYLVTGTPGAGKTLNTIKMVMDMQKENPERQVFYFDIADCKVEGWTELETPEAVHQWKTLPQNSIVIVDESYKVWKQRNGKEEVPLSAQQLAEHRHLGFDFFLITQAPKNLDVFVRRLVGAHYHYDRRFGAKTVNRYMWNRIEENPNDQWKKKEAVRESIKFDKKVFDLYKSAEVHTHKRSYPPKLVIGVVFIISIPFLIWFFGTNLGLYAGEHVGLDEKPSPQGNLPDNLLPFQDGEITEDRYLQLRVPRVEGWPHTAPIYDEVTTVKTYPRYNCIMPADKPRDCKCYSQQATLLDTTTAVCLKIMNAGFFDSAREENDKPNRPRTARQGSADQSAPSGVPKGPSTILIGNPG